MMQHSPDGTPFFMHANLGKPTPFVPGSFETYVRRWQASMIHGKAFPRVLNEAAGVDDFERWYYDSTRPRVLVRRQTAEALVPHPRHRAVRGGFPRLGSLQHQR